MPFVATTDAAKQALRTTSSHQPRFPSTPKSLLVQTFLDEVVQQRALVLSGKCYEREPVPYKALDSLVDSLSRYLGSLTSAEVESVLPREVQLLTRLFPVLNRVSAVAKAPGSRTTARANR